MPTVRLEDGPAFPWRRVLQERPTRKLDPDLILGEQHMDMRRLERELPAVDDE
jgi:hypothetical protein